jgi:hypothetical protein
LPAFVQKIALAESEIVSHEDKMNIIIDLSSLTLPKNTIFHGFQTDFGKGVWMEKLETVGLQNILKGNMDINFSIKVKVPRKSFE